jgi:O-antigen ligase
VGGALGLIFIAVLHREGRRGFVRTASVTALLGVMVVIVLSPPPALERLVGGADPYGYVAQSTEERAQIYPAVWHEILQRPLVGHGFEYVRGAHNIYLQLLHAGGLIALTAFFIFAVGITVRGLRLAGTAAIPADLRSLATASVASLGVWLAVGGLVGTAIFDRFLYIPAGLILALGVWWSRSGGQPSYAALGRGGEPQSESAGEGSI